MPEPGYAALFLVGLLGGGHCVGMCGGIVGALAAQGAGTPWRLHFAYNGGRILSYCLAGAVAGAIGGLGASWGGVVKAQWLLYVLANLMLVALGIYLMGWTASLSAVERMGQALWRRVAPLGARFLPARTVGQALPLGMVWGWLPCGLVYSALATALASGSVERGALSMLAFGLGTLPNLLLAGVLLSRFKRFAQARAVRWTAGALVLAFGVLGLLRAGHFVGTA